MIVESNRLGSNEQVGCMFEWAMINNSLRRGRMMMMAKEKNEKKKDDDVQWRCIAPQVLLTFRYLKTSEPQSSISKNL